MKYAWIDFENERIRDICQGGDPADCYTPNVAVYYFTLVPDEAQNGDGWVNGQWVPTPPPEVVEEEVLVPGSAPNVIS